MDERIFQTRKKRESCFDGINHFLILKIQQTTRECLRSKKNNNSCCCCHSGYRPEREKDGILLFPCVRMTCFESSRLEWFWPTCQYKNWPTRSNKRGSYHILLWFLITGLHLLFFGDLTVILKKDVVLTSLTIPTGN